MNRPVRAMQVARVLVARLERERRAIAPSESDWDAGFRAGLTHAQHILRKGQ